MKLLVLAAGYATRLYPLTLDRPKGLLPVGGRPMVERVLDVLLPIEEIDAIYLVTNSKFAGQFSEWAAGHSSDIVVVDDGTTDDSNKRGAIGDMALVLERGRIDDDLIVVAFDNLFSNSLEGFGRFCLERDAPVLGVYDVGDLDLMVRYGAVEVDGSGQITYFEEKPAEPRSTLAAIALYFYPRHALGAIRQYVAEGNDPDQPGRLVQWLYPRMPVYAWPVPGVWYDIGSKESLEEADRVFSEPES